jgi:hypothetical protein
MPQVLVKAAMVRLWGVILNLGGQEWDKANFLKSWSELLATLVMITSTNDGMGIHVL